MSLSGTKWVEGVTDPRVWTTKGPLDLNEVIELPSDEADYLIGRNQAIETTAPNAPGARVEGDDVED